MKYQEENAYAKMNRFTAMMCSRATKMCSPSD